MIDDKEKQKDIQKKKRELQGRLRKREKVISRNQDSGILFKLEITEISYMGFKKSRKKVEEILYLHLHQVLRTDFQLISKEIKN